MRNMHTIMLGLFALFILLAAPGCPPSSPPIQVALTTPANGAQGIDVSVTITITFDLPADKDTLDVSIAPAVSFIIGWSSDGRIAYLYPNNDLAPGTEYTVTVHDVASTEDEWIEDEYIFSFTTQASVEGELEGEGAEEGEVEGPIEGFEEGEIEGEGEAPGTYREEMREFVEAISAYAKARHPGFLIVPQNGEALLTLNGEPDGTLSQEYLDAIDGQGREDVFYGYDGDNIPTPAEVREQFIGML
ncbi:MAG TPA: Ig-like domain-containing protein, partial [Candidatus Hydrogenedentes bacterium]|nr:Ig-like domain-containing protein [Candidatus Hydrogenedentota bacterium]